MLRTLAVSFSIGLLGLAIGCGGGTELKDQASSSENQITVIMAPLHEERPTIATYRSVMHNLNGYFDSLGESYRSQIVVSPEQRSAAEQCLRGSRPFDLARRIDETKSKSFNVLSDASHLDACLLFRDAAQSLVADLGEAPPASDAAATEGYQLDLAKHVFEWSTRQVILKPHAGGFDDHWAPHDILRRGYGDPTERLLVFLSILGQTDLPGCAILVKKQFKEDNLTITRSVPVLAGVLIGKSLYVFDSHQGKAVPAPDGKGIATLTQLQQADQLKTILGSNGPTPTQLKDAEIVLYCSFPSLAPRMRALEHEFDLQSNQVHLFKDLPAQLARFKAASFSAKPWASEARPGEPALLINNYVTNPLGDLRLAWVRSLRERLIPAWALEADKQIGDPGTPQSLLYEFDRRFLSLLFEPGGGRDLLVRGKAAQAVAKIAKYENALDRALDMFHGQSAYTVGNFRNYYLENTAKLHLDVAKSQSDWRNAQAASAPSAQIRQLESRYLQARMVYESVWKQELFVNMANNLGSEWAMPELREHITYFIGLAKMELALQAERRWKKNPNAPWPVGLPKPAEQFATASQWFGRYEALVLTMNSSNWLDAVKARHAECDQKQAELSQLAER
jgi:hypothetical protein